MNPIKYLFASLFILINFSAFSQSTEAVFMKWKLKPGEVISYKTVMEEIDTANRKYPSFDGFNKTSGVDSTQADDKKFFKQISNEMSHLKYTTHLTENKKNIIDIEMIARDTTAKKPITDTGQAGVTEKSMRLMMSKMTQNVTLRGAIFEDGTIESFYTASGQRNLIAFFFELPGHSVKVGDSWPLSVDLFSVDQNFKCDSSYKRNRVTIVKIEKRKNEQIVTLKYDILEYIFGYMISPFDSSYIQTSMKVCFQADATFSIEKGKWLTYEGIMSNSSTGLMSAQTSEKYSLVEE